MWCIFSLDQYRDIIAPGGPFEGARKLKDEGLVRHLAFSAHAPTRDIITMCEEGLFEAALLSFNIINHKARREGLMAARRMNLGLATMNPLGGGLLPQMKNHVKSAEEELGEGFLATALRFVASHEEVSVVLSGMKNPEEVEANVKALENLEKPDRKTVDAIAERLGDLGKSFCTICRYCLPCPEGIDIPAFMAAYDLHKVGMQQAGRVQLGFRRSKDGPESCSECGECEERCTQQLPIIDRLKGIEGRFGKKY
jgi:predicted aldo/keto reductase-like oxidoreductase